MLLGVICKHICIIHVLEKAHDQMFEALEIAGSNPDTTTLFSRRQVIKCPVCDLIIT